MKRIGIIGFGFMGNMHFNNYAQIEGVKVAAICDIDESKLSGKAGAAGNIEGVATSAYLPIAAPCTRALFERGGWRACLMDR